MPIVRFEVKEYGAAESKGDLTIVPTIKKQGVTKEVAATGSSVKVFGPFDFTTNVVVKPIGCQIYMAFGQNPNAAAAPAPGDHIPDGGFASCELAPGDEIAIRLATLS